MALSMVNSIVKWNPYSCSFATYDNKLKLYEVFTSPNGTRDAILTRSMAISGEVTTLDWYRGDPSISKALAYGTSVASVYFLNWTKGQPEFVALRQAKKSRQQCTEVTWNPIVKNQVAAGFDKSKKENCAYVYDLEAGSTADFRGSVDFPHSSSFSTDTVISLCWLRSTLIAAGGDRGIVSIFDLRALNEAPMTVMAHANASSRMSKKVKGIRSNPFDENVVATFSDLTGEPVKIWDMRKLDRSKEAPVFTVHPHDPVFGATERGSSQSIVTAVEFSKSRPNIVAVGTSQKEYVSLYCIKSSPSEFVSRTPVATLPAPGGVKYLSWQACWDHPTTSDSSIQSSPVETLFSTQREQRPQPPQVFSGAGIAPPLTHQPSRDPLDDLRLTSSSSPGIPPGAIACETSNHRLLIATAGTTMEFMDVIIRESQPLGYGALDTVAFGQGKVVCVSTPSDEREAPLSPTRPNLTRNLRSRSNSGRGRNFSDHWVDIDDVMKARCAAGYSIDPGKNIQALHDELDAIDPSSASGQATMQLLRAWNWVDRVEQLHQADYSLNLSNCGLLQLLLKGSPTKATNENHTVTLLHPILGCNVYVSSRRSVGRLLCGWGALHAVNSSKESLPSEHPESQDLKTIVEEFETVEHFERATALALWHGNISLAVKVLQRTIKANKATASTLDEEENGERFIDELTPDYIQLLSLVAMCLAGYGNRTKQAQTRAHRVSSSESADSEATPVSIEDGSQVTDSNLDEDQDTESDEDDTHIWESMCLHVLERLESTERRAAAYLHACCKFLLESIQHSEGTILRENGHDGYSMLHDDRIAFEDRVAFACTYLSSDEMSHFLQNLEEQCMAQGNIEGLVITGLNTDSGFQLLQMYLDRRSDIQTAALMVARFPTLLGPPNASQSSMKVNHPVRQFLPEYRQLLNRWQFFIERASLDVELGRRYRSHLARNPPPAPAGSGSTSNRIGLAPGTRSSAQAASDPQNTNAADRITYRIPPHNDSPHIFVRCHYCGTSLPVDSMMRQLHYQSSTSLRKQKPVMFCCPNCKKPLPKCYICLGSMGVVNPQAEIKVHLARKTQQSAGGGPATPVPTTPRDTNVEEEICEMANPGQTTETTQNFLESGKWFMWCQHCKHGGHAACVDSWFHSHAVCGVNGCHCNCMIRPSTASAGP